MDKNLEKLDQIAKMFEAAALELRAVRLHDGEISDEQRNVLLREAQANALRVADACREAVPATSPEWRAVMGALQAAYEDHHLHRTMAVGTALRSILDAYGAWLNQEVT